MAAPQALAVAMSSPSPSPSPSHPPSSSAAAAACHPSNPSSAPSSNNYTYTTSTSTTTSTTANTSTSIPTGRTPSSSYSSTPIDISPSPSTTSLNTSCCSPAQTPIDLLRRYPTDLTTPIPEEGDEETGSESFSNEPVTPVSGRQSRDFHYCENNDIYHRDSTPNVLATPSGLPEQSDVPLNQSIKEAPNPPLLAASSLSPSFAPPSYAPPLPPPQSPPQPQPSQASGTPHEPLDKSLTTQSEPKSPRPDRRPSTTPVQRPSSRRSSSSTLSKAMSSLFKRSSYNVAEHSAASTAGATMEFKEPNYNSGTSETNLPSANKMATPNTGRRRFSYHRSATTTVSNTPPSPGSPIEAAPSSGERPNGTGMPSPRDFFENNSKKNRAHTGLSIRSRVNFATSKSHTPRRTKSLERKKRKEEDNLTRQPWAIPPEVGTGMKARRLSLSLPDDFTVDVAELVKEFEYQHKLLGRHGRHLGKGATSKVTLMVRKGSPTELYAVKEFRSKSSSETTNDYEKKIKSEYSIAKSLHHPNIVETIRLCTNHGRWNHVMEYCSEGDLFGLVSKKYLKEEGREVDRTCLFKQLCQGINYLHSNGIAHRDIKLENLLITKDSKLKITDFGVSEVFSGIHPGLREAGGQCGIGMGDIRLCKPGICGSLPYIAPEVLKKDRDYDPRALDVWSAAIVMLYLIFNANLWEKAEPGGIQKNYNDLARAWEKFEAKKASNPEAVSKEAYPKVLPFEMFVKPAALRRLLLNMLNPDPEKRITMNDVVTNRWMKNVECCQLESYEDPIRFIDASKKDCMKGTTGGKIFCHSHLPPMSQGHGLPPMPGKPGY